MNLRQLVLPSTLAILKKGKNIKHLVAKTERKLRGEILWTSSNWSKNGE